MYKNKQSVRISHFRSFLFVTVMWILGSITVKVNKNVFTWSKELPKKYTHRVNEKSMDIQGNEHTLFILLTTFFFHSPLSFCFSFFHVFSFLSISCIILKPSHIPFFSVSHLGHYWCHTLLYLLLCVIKLGFFNSYLHQQQNCTRNCIRTAISSLYSIYNALLNLPRLLLW